MADFKLDTFVTGIVPQPTGPMITARYKGEKRKQSYATGSVYTIPAGCLCATSRYFGDQVARSNGTNVAYINWWDRVGLEIYLQWTQDRIVHRKSRPQSPTPGSDIPVTDQEDVRPKDEIPQFIEDCSILMYVWMTGAKVQDNTFMDTVLSMLSELVQRQENGVEIFLNNLTPTLVKMVFAGTNESEPPKLREFVVDVIAKFVTTESLDEFLDPETFGTKFVEFLESRLESTIPLHILPSGIPLQRPHASRILLPSGPFTAEMLRGSDDKDFLDSEPADIHGLSGRQLQNLATWVVSKGIDKCAYHVHGERGRCWLEQLR